MFVTALSRRQTLTLHKKKNAPKHGCHACRIPLAGITTTSKRWYIRTFAIVGWSALWFPQRLNTRNSASSPKPGPAPLRPTQGGNGNASAQRYIRGTHMRVFFRVERCFPHMKGPIALSSKHKENRSSPNLLYSSANPWPEMFHVSAHTGISGPTPPSFQCTTPSPLAQALSAGYPLPRQTFALHVSSMLLIPGAFPGANAGRDENR